ncbi:hypothetical protein SE16_14550 [Ardenticatena maritima]|nr:response regulator transcription factor [Ardenticatena maritima]KPL86494.1 hypothetical protein SE16_14550 [Ardenticatena maritima]
MHLILLATTPEAENQALHLLERSSHEMTLVATHCLSPHRPLPNASAHTIILAFDHNSPAHSLDISAIKTHFNAPLLLVAAPLAIVPDALRQGANGCFTTWPHPHELCAALTLITNGHTFLDRHAAALLNLPFAPSLTAPPEFSPFAQLTKREQQVLAILGHGASNQEIARVLGISITTVRTHLKHLYRKLGARNRSELIHMAMMCHEVFFRLFVVREGRRSGLNL